LKVPAAIEASAKRLFLDSLGVFLEKNLAGRDLAQGHDDVLVLGGIHQVFGTFRIWRTRLAAMCTKRKRLGTRFIQSSIVILANFFS